MLNSKEKKDTEKIMEDFMGKVFQRKKRYN